MHWLSIIIIGIASNLDNLGIGISFGMRSTKIPLFSNFIIACISMIGTYLSIILGSFLTNYVPLDIANFLGGFIIIAIGIWTIGSSRKKKDHQQETTVNPPSLSEVLNNPSRADLDDNHYISYKESVFLGLALALNSIATGIGAGISGLSPFVTTLSVGLFSFITVGVGVSAGLKISHTWICKYADVIAGALLMGIGFYEILI
jgi:putative sporulation protein YtaF